ncbi:Rhamnogalacturonyl hydrolase YesR [Spirosomataceae bacterium TFI 002]|nr:Rhamnogalacturonyl hydrolase YesR [Spirosomataceae bacterium TFI 002]
MKNTLYLLFILSFFFAGSTIANEPLSLSAIDQTELKNKLFLVADWQNKQTAHQEKYNPLNWHFATLYIGLMELHKTTGEQKYFDQLYKLGKLHNWTTENRVFDADRIAIGQVYIDLFKEKKEPEIIQRLQWVMDAHLERMPKPDVRFMDNKYRREWWTWCDALFMAPPTFAKMYAISGDEKYLDYAIDNWIITTKYLQDKNDKFFFRDDRYFEHQTPNNKNLYWSRGNGWVVAGLANMLTIIPKNHPKRLFFEDQFKTMVAKIAEVQQADGLWRPSLLDPETFPQPETSGSSFFCYAFLWGVNNGLLDAEVYMPKALKAWNGLEALVNSEGRLGFVQPPGKEPLPYTEEAWEEYGTGAFLIAGCELLKAIDKNEISQSVKKGKLIYDNPLSEKDDLKNWQMEGPGKTEFKENWMHMNSPNEEGHHVLWCPEDFPGSFIAEWEVQNLETDAGLVIMFFSAKGVNGEDIFDKRLKKRDGVFRGYTKSDLNNYHISYYANGRDNRERVVAHLRKNAGFNLVQNGEDGIPAKSTSIHKVVLTKNDNHILMTIDGREVVNWTDDGKAYGAVLQGGKMGFRQMQWTHFRYRNFKVYALE